MMEWAWWNGHDGMGMVEWAWWNGHSAGDLVKCLGGFNGHVGRRIDGVCGGYGVGKRNLEGRMLLEFCLEKELCVSCTWFERGIEDGDIQNG